MNKVFWSKLDVALHETALGVAGRARRAARLARPRASAPRPLDGRRYLLLALRADLRLLPTRIASTASARRARAPACRRKVAMNCWRPVRGGRRLPISATTLGAGPLSAADVPHRCAVQQRQDLGLVPSAMLSASSAKAGSPSSRDAPCTAFDPARTRGGGSAPAADGLLLIRRCWW